MKHKRFVFGIGVTAVMTLFSLPWLMSFEKSSEKKRDSDHALLAIVKDDLEGFKAFIEAGGTLDQTVEIGGRKVKVADLIINYERIHFLRLVTQKNIAGFSDDDWKLAIEKNNPEVFEALRLARPDARPAQLRFGKEGWNLLHIAAANCSDKLLGPLEALGLTWKDKAKDGRTPLTLSAQKDCLQVMSYWRSKSADFKALDGSGMSALKILRKKKDAALSAFRDSIEGKRFLAYSDGTILAGKAPNFYKKRVVPKDNLFDRAHLLEPGERPEEANETAEYSEFSD